MVSDKSSRRGRTECAASDDRPLPAWMTDSATGEVQYVHHPSFSLPETERRLWKTPLPESCLQRFSLMPVIESTSTATRADRTVLQPQTEKLLFLRYNYAKYRLRKAVSESAHADRSRELKRWVRRARDTRRQLAHANLPLVPSMARKILRGSAEFEELVSEGNLAVLRSIEKFDVSRGFKFSTYTCRSIFSAFIRVTRKNRTRLRHEPVYFDPALEPSDEVDRRHQEQQAYAIETVRRVFEANTAGLTDVEHAVIARRFGMNAAPPETLKQVAAAIGVSTERVRQIERRSLARFRGALDQRAEV